MKEALGRLREILGEASDLERAAALLHWDSETYMPPKGVGARAGAAGTVERLAHERLASPEVGELLARLEAAALDPEGDDAALVRVARRDHDQAVKLPASLVEEAARTSMEARPVWVEARARSDWSLFAPALRRNVDINRRIAEALGYSDRPYDALLDRSEPGITTRQLDALFAELRAAIVPLVRAIAERPAVDDSAVHGDFDPEAQLEFGRLVIGRFGYDFEAGRQDLSAHPFSIGIGPGDVRITTRLSREFLPQGMFGTMHESGHAMYTQGHSNAYAGTPLWGGASPGVHESQSRLWENLVGRSRAFWRCFLPDLVRLFPQLRGVGEEAFYRAVNRVQPSLVRVEADEVTYNLHILLRYELENDMLEGELAVEEVPEAWREKMERYLGIAVPDDASGPLQDIHWSGPWFGSFPGYTLGNVIGAQLMEAARRELGDLDSEFERGEFARLLGWLREHVHAHGRRYLPAELVERVTGRPLAAGPWIEYVRAKFGEIYELDGV